MERNLYLKLVDDEIGENDYDPGCMWGFIHALDYHHWHYNLKRMLHLKKHQGRRTAKVKGNPKTRILEHSEELQQLLGGNRSQIRSMKSPTSANKRSLRARMKAFIAEEVSKKENSKQRKTGFSPSPQLQRTFSIHHLESSDDFRGKIRLNKKPAIIFLPATLDNVKRSSDSPKMKAPVKSEISLDLQFRKGADILEILKASQELCQNSGGNADDGRTRKVRFTKSGSFPSADKSWRNFRPSNLEHKQTEIWFPAERERLRPSYQVPKYKKLFRAKSWDSAYDIDRRYMDFKSRNMFQISKGEVKHEIANTSEEYKSEHIEAPTENSSSDVPSGSERETTARGGACARNTDDLKESSELDGYFLGKRAFYHRRSSSLNDLLDRYSKLFEFGSRQELKLHTSKSLLFRNDNDPLLSVGHASFRRVRSLSHLDFWTGDAQYVDRPPESVLENNSTTEGNNLEEGSPVSAAVTTDEEAAETISELVVHTINTIQAPSDVSSRESNAVTDYLTEDFDDSILGRSTSYREEDALYSETSAAELSQSFKHTNSGASLLGDSSSAYSSKGLENHCSQVDESASLTSILEQRAHPDSSNRMLNLESFVNRTDAFTNLGYSQVYNKDNADMFYVTEILERSGLSKDAFYENFPSADYPLNISAFDEMEAYWHQEVECSEEDICGCSHHRFLFDLVNEVLHQLYDRKLAYYPKALSSNCRVHLMPTKSHILEEASASINTLLRQEPDRYQTLEGIVAHDLAMNDGWMNLQSESEYVGLELEDMISDELLEELIFAELAELC